MPIERQDVISLHTPPDVVAARVVAAGVCTCYQAAGRGPSVVVLSAVPSRVATLLADVPRRFRVIAPDLAVCTTDDFAGWIDSFLDALGLSHVWLVADAEFAAFSLAYARAMPERVRGIVILPADGSAVASVHVDDADRVANAKMIDRAVSLFDGGLAPCFDPKI